MMLPIRISVSVTPPPWACCADIRLHANNAAARRDIERLVSVIFCINIASNAKLTSAYDALPGDHDNTAHQRVIEIKYWPRCGNRIAWPQPSAQRNIKPAKRVDGHAVAAIDQHRRGFGLDDRGAAQAMAGPQVV